MRLKEGDLIKLPQCRHGMEVFGKLTKNGHARIEEIVSTCARCLEFGMVSVPVRIQPAI